MNNAVSEKPCEMWENIDIKLITTKARRNYLVSEPNYHTKDVFSENY